MFQDNKNLINVMNDNENSIPRNALGVHCRGMWKMRVLFENVGFIHRMARVESQRVQLSIIHTIVKSGLRLNSFFFRLGLFSKKYIFLPFLMQSYKLKFFEELKSPNSHKFSSEERELAEHVAIYHIECGNMDVKEHLNIKYFIVH